MWKRVVTVFVVGVVMIGAGQSSFARLGETEAELVARYGKPGEVKPNPPEAPPAEKAMVFLKGDMVVIVHILKGRSVSEFYWFHDPDGKEMPVEKDLPKAEALLQANSADSVWEMHPAEVANKRMSLFWKRSDGKAQACVWKGEPEILQVQDLAFVNESAKSRSQKESGLSGF